MISSKEPLIAASIQQIVGDSQALPQKLFERLSCLSNKCRHFRIRLDKI